MKPTLGQHGATKKDKWAASGSRVARGHPARPGYEVPVALVALVVGAVAMGSSPVFVRFSDVGPQASAFWRTFLSLPFLYAWVRVDAVRGTPPTALMRRSVILSGLFFAGDLLFWHLAILGTTIANATLLATTTPIFVAAGAFLFLAESVAARTVGGIVLCLAGAVALVGDTYGFAPHRLTGDVFGIITAVFFGSYMLALSAARHHLSAARLSLVSTAISCVVLAFAAGMIEQPLLPSSVGGWAAVLALAVICQAAGQGLLVVALGTLPATFSSLVIFIEAIAAAVFGWLIFGEALGALQALGGTLILAGIWIARPQPSEKMANGKS